MEILRQLGELFLQAVPTVILVFLFYLFLRAHFFPQMERVLAERAARTEGARQAADAARAAAAQKEAAYQATLKQARAEIYAEQEAARRTVLEERARLVREARERGQQEIRSAKQRVIEEMAAARRELEAESSVLAEQIARLVLGAEGTAPSPSRVR